MVLAAVIVGFSAFGTYNGLVGEEERVDSAWANVETAYQRRADLIPNLVATVQGASDFEQETLTQVVEARAGATQATIEATPEMLGNPAAFARFQAAQDQLSSALSRLLLVVERYPELKAVAAYQDLMVQLEGTENRISVERNRYNGAAQGFNTRIRRVPAAWLISIFGWDFGQKAYFTAEEGAQEAPDVSFD